jgi:hypothetical protein
MAFYFSYQACTLKLIKKRLSYFKIHSVLLLFLTINQTTKATRQIGQNSPNKNIKTTPATNNTVNITAPKTPNAPKTTITTIMLANIASKADMLIVFNDSANCFFTFTSHVTSSPNNSRTLAPEKYVNKKVATIGSNLHTVTI